MAFADIPAVPESASPDGKIHAVMNIDRDPKMSPDIQNINSKQIEITEKKTGRILISVAYSGATDDDERPLREHVRVSWRPDSKAFAITIDNRFYSSSRVFALSKDSKFVEVAFPGYEAMTGFPVPDNNHLRPIGRSTVKGWDSDGRLIYDLFLSPLPTFSGHDPLEHRVYLDVSATKMTTVKVIHEEGRWLRGDWMQVSAEQGGGGQPATRPEFE